MAVLVSPLRPSTGFRELKQNAAASSSSCSSFFRSEAGLQPPKNSISIRRSSMLVVATIKRKKDYALDDVIEREKKLKMVNKVKSVIVKQPGKVISLMELGKRRNQIGLPGKRKFVSMLRKFPAVFRLFEEGAGTIYCRLTPAAEAQYREELELKKQVEDVLVLRLRKLLMMSVDKRILLRKIVHLKKDFGLPGDFANEMLPKYPEYFTVVMTASGPALELKHWDPELAVTFEQKKKAEVKEDFADVTVSGRVPKFPRLNFQKGFKPPKKDLQLLQKFYQVPLVSPYEDASHLKPWTPEAERRAVAVVHELLSLTIEKRTLVDHLTHFRNDFKFSQRLYWMIIRHPELFYISFKGDRHTVFLREAYNDRSELIEKDPLVLVKEKLARLVSISKEAIKAIEESDGEDDGSWSSDEDANETDAFLRDRRKQRELAIAMRPRVEPW